MCAAMYFTQKSFHRGIALTRAQAAFRAFDAGHVIGVDTAA